MSQPETRPKGEIFSTKRLVFVWLFGGIIEWTIQYANQWLSPSTAGKNLPFEAAIGDVCAVLFFCGSGRKCLRCRGSGLG